jgi:hypothetical protein
MGATVEVTRGDSNLTFLHASATRSRTKRIRLAAPFRSAHIVTSPEKTMFAPARHLDPLRIVHGTRGDRYDCPDVSIVDHHILRLRRRAAAVGDQSPDVAEICHTDIDLLLDHRAWLTLPVAPHRPVTL